MVEHREQSSPRSLQLVSGSHIVLVMDPTSNVAAWLEQAGASYASLWEDRYTLEGAAARELTKDAAVIVIDLDIGTARALEIATAVSPPCAVLFMADQIDAATCRCIARVHWGYRSKSSHADDFLLAVRRLLRLHVPDMERVAARAARMWNLPLQQARVLYLNLWSYSDQDIADALDVSVHTVQEYQDELRRKTGARTKQGYLARLLELSGTSPPLQPHRPFRARRKPSRAAAARPSRPAGSGMHTRIGGLLPSLEG